MPIASVLGPALCAVITGVITGLGSVLVLRRLPEPAADEPGAEEKPAYRSLATPAFVVAVVVASVVLSASAAAFLPTAQWPPWLVLAGPVVLLAAIDTATTWLPNALMYPTWVAMAGAVALTPVLGAPFAVVLRMLVSGAAWGVLFWLVWLISRRQIGFGDVRLAVVLGAAAGSPSWASAYVCLLLGTIAGAVWGGVHRLRHGAEAPPFAYGGALLLGCWLGLVLLGLLE